MANHGSTRNFLVPSDGKTHTVWTQFIASAIPYEINWDQFSVDNFQFYPQGAYVNNVAGAAPLVVTITPIQFTFTVPAGQARVVQFPAPITNQGASITGNGSAVIHWVDYPTFPDNAGQVVIANSAAAPLFVAPATGAVFTTSVQELVQASGGTKTNVNAAIASTALLAANPARKTATLFNDATGILYLDLTGGVASATSFSVAIQPGGYYELPAPRTTGALTGIWSVIGGAVRITELT